MICPKCGAHSEVYASEPTAGGTVVRRRRRCLRSGCGNRWTTYEQEMVRRMELRPVTRPNGGAGMAEVIMGVAVGCFVAALVLAMVHA